MKKILLISAAVFLIHLLPVHATAEFFLKINRTGRFTVYFADQKQSTPSNQFRFFDMNGGLSNIRIVEDFTNKVIFNGNVTLNNGYRTVAEFDVFGTLRIIDNIQVQQTVWYMDYYPGIQNMYSNNTGNWNNNWGGYTGNNPNTWNYNNNSGWSGTNNNNNNGWNNNWNNTGSWNNQGVDDHNFNGMRDYVKNQNFDSDKLSAAKEISRTNQLRSSQVAELCKLFSFDNTRLEYAKYAYDYVTDKGSYYLVSNTFTFSSNANELRDYIATH